MANSHRANLTSYLDLIFKDIAVYVIQNIGSISSLSEDDLTNEFMKIIGEPRPPQAISSMSGMLPQLSNLTAGPKSSATKKKAEIKDAPQQLWLEFDDYKKRYDEGQELCGYYCTSSTDAAKKNKICGAIASEITDPEKIKWRCVSCKDKFPKSLEQLRKKMEKDVKKGSPTAAQNNFNVPNVPPVLGIPSSVKKTSDGIPPANFGVISTSIPTIPQLSAIPGMTELSKSSPISTINNNSTLKSPVRIPEIVPVPQSAPVPAPAPAPVSTPAWVNVEGLPSHWTYNAPGLSEFLFERTPDKFLCIGRFTGDVSADSLNKLSELNETEKAKLTEYGIQYVYRAPVTATLMSFPSLPGLPNLPTLG